MAERETWAAWRGSAGGAGDTGVAGCVIWRSGSAGGTGNAGDTGGAGDAGDAGDAGGVGDAGDAGDMGDAGGAGDAGCAGDAGDTGGADNMIGAVEPAGWASEPIGLSPLCLIDGASPERTPVFNDFSPARKKNRVSWHEIAVFNGRPAEYSLTTGNTCHFGLPSTRKPLTTENTCHEMDYYLREEVEIIEYRKYVPPISRIQR